MSGRVGGSISRRTGRGIRWGVSGGFGRRHGGCVGNSGGRSIGWRVGRSIGWCFCGCDGRRVGDCIRGGVGRSISGSASAEDRYPDAGGSLFGAVPTDAGVIHDGTRVAVNGIDIGVGSLDGDAGAFAAETFGEAEVNRGG